MDEEAEHVVPLMTDLEPHLHPVKFSLLEELGLFKRPEQISGKDFRTVKVQALTSLNLGTTKN